MSVLFQRDAVRAPSKGLLWMASLTLALCACEVGAEPDNAFRPGDRDLQEQLDALTGQVDELQSQVSNHAFELNRVRVEYSSGLDWEVFTYTCGVDDEATNIVNEYCFWDDTCYYEVMVESTEGLVAEHVKIRVDDFWRDEGVKYRDGQVALQCYTGEETVYRVALGFERPSPPEE